MAKSDTKEAEGFQGVMDESGEGFTFDMSNQEADAGYPIMPKGTYPAIIDNAEYQISKSKGNPMWKITHLITGPEEWASKNLKVFSYVVFKPDQMGRVREFLQKIGKDDLSTSDFNPKRIADDGLLVGAEHSVKLDIRKSEEYGDSNEVKRVLKAGSDVASGEGGFSMS